MPTSSDALAIGLLTTMLCTGPGVSPARAAPQTMAPGVPRAQRAATVVRAGDRTVWIDAQGLHDAKGLVLELEGAFGLAGWPDGQIVVVSNDSGRARFTRIAPDGSVRHLPSTQRAESKSVTLLPDPSLDQVWWVDSNRRRASRYVLAGEQAERDRMVELKGMQHSDVAVLPDGNLMVSAPGGLVRIDEQGHRLRIPWRASSRIQRIHAGADGGLWVLQTDGRVVHLDPSSNVLSSNNLPGEGVELAVDGPRAVVATGTREHGEVRYKLHSIDANGSISELVSDVPQHSLAVHILEAGRSP